MWPFKDKTPPRSPDARSHVVAPEGRRSLDKDLAASSPLRRRSGTRTEPKRGMWVVWSGRTGILTNLEPGHIATVMMVDDIGHNSIEIHCSVAELRQAWFEEIPLARRPTYAAAEPLGYHHRPSA